MLFTLVLYCFAAIGVAVSVFCIAVWFYEWRCEHEIAAETAWRRKFELHYNEFSGDLMNRVRAIEVQLQKKAKR